MNTIVLLDTGILGLIITSHKISEEAGQCRQWLKSLPEKGFDIRVPEIADYEIRRELLRLGKARDIKRLDQLGDTLGYVPLNTQVMRVAAEFWSIVRRQGKPTASDKALDGDVILAAQASLLKSIERKVMIATTNVAHLSLLADARIWKDVK